MIKHWRAATFALLLTSMTLAASGEDGVTDGTILVGQTIGITGTIAQFNTACTDADFATGGGTATAGNDYVVTSLSAQTIAAGSTSIQVQIAKATPPAVAPADAPSAANDDAKLIAAITDAEAEIARLTAALNQRNEMCQSLPRTRRCAGQGRAGLPRRYGRSDHDCAGSGRNDGRPCP